jgi:hypothetical protein
MERRDPESEWRIDPEEYPQGGTPGEQLRFLIRYAILAPSSHNTQPWRFRLRGDRLEVLADRTRRLPVVDPHDRALVISCGAAIGMLRAAMRRFGRKPEIALLPESDAPDLLARVGLGTGHDPTETDEARFAAIARRRTTRLRFEPATLPSGLEKSLVDIAEADGAEAIVVPDAGRKAKIADLVAEGDRVQFADPAFRRELGAWVHSRRRSSRDGMSGAAFGMPDKLSAVGGLVIRTFDMGDGIAAKDAEIAAGSPALLLVATPGDEPRDWLLAGMAHAEMLLAVTAEGLTAAYLNQPVEVDHLRPRLRAAAGASRIPQLLLRIGRGPAIAPAVRRPAEAVIEE